MWCILCLPHRWAAISFDFLRSIACMGVVGIHAITIGLWIRDDTLPAVNATLQATQMLLMFSTPAFVFLSAVILGYRYQRSPPRFLRKRCQFVVVPFVSMNLTYALYYAVKDLSRHGDFELFTAELASSSLRNLLGGNHLWFIIPIVQFYVLYRLIGHRLTKLPAATALGGTLVANVAYLAAFNFTPPLDDAYTGFVGKPWYSLLFPAWAFYFVAGIYVGSRYPALRGILRRRIGGILLALGTFGSVVLLLHFSSILQEVSSRRVDVLFYTYAMIMTLLYAASRLSRIPAFFLSISRFSFAIYLLHPLALNFLWPQFVPFRHLPLPILVAVLWVGGIGLSYVAARLVALLPFGSIFIGRIRFDDSPNRLSHREAEPGLSRQHVA